MSHAQQRTWERLWPELGYVARPPGESEFPGEPLDTQSSFGRTSPLVLEIGCGAGTSTLAMAGAEPDVDVVAVEVYRRGLAQLLSAMDREASPTSGSSGGGRRVLEQSDPDSLGGVRVFFPDPWPKARHHKPRLLQPETVALIADRLRPAVVPHAATDHAGYSEQIAEVGDAEPLTVQAGRRRANRRSPSVRPTTKYESKAQDAGSAVTELLWERRRP